MTPGKKDAGGLGRAGEDKAANWYRLRGWKVLERNYRTRLGEIDLIVCRGDVLAFVEVKARGANALGRPCEAVDKRKQQKLTAAAQQFLAQYSGAEQQLRFDVMEIWPDKWGVWRCECIENAFWL